MIQHEKVIENEKDLRSTLDIDSVLEGGLRQAWVVVGNQRDLVRESSDLLARKNDEDIACNISGVNLKRTLLKEGVPQGAHLVLL